MMRRTSLFGAVAALGLAAVGCSSDGFPESKVRHLSDEDGDGMFSTPACEDPSADGECVIIPGPTDCDYIIFTSTWTTIVDAAGNVVSEGWQDCIQCADAAFNPVGAAECSGGTVDPIVCEPLDDVLPGGGGDDGMSGGGAPESRADAYYGGGVYPTSICWWCHDSGSTSYVECVEPPPPGCTTDDECGPGYHCEYWAPTPCDAPDGSFCAAGAEDSAALVAAGTCVPDYETYCSTDEECGPGYYCDYGYGYPEPMPADGGSAGGGSDGAPAPDIAPIAGRCVPEPYSDYCFSDDDCRAFGEGWTCVYDSWTCPDGYACPAAEGTPSDMPTSPVVVSGTCQPPLPPPPADRCAGITDPATCYDNRCAWAETDPACGTDALCAGFCYDPYFATDGGAGGAEPSPR